MSDSVASSGMTSGVADAIPKVSVVIPVYNSEAFIGDCLSRVLQQTLQGIEVVCVDDGSTDESARIVGEFAQRDARVHLIRQENAGPGPARNAGIRAAHGRFVAFLDADDRYSSDDYLRALVDGAETNGVDVAGACFYNDHKGRLERDFSDDPDLVGYTFKKRGVVEYRDYQFDYGFHRFLFSRNLLMTLAAAVDAATGPFPALTFFEDPVFLVRALDKAGRFFATDEVGYCYRCNYKVPHWTTKKTIDLLEGVRRNLAYSKQHDLPLLHWYTVRHYELESAGIGLGVNPDVSVDAVAGEIVRAEQCIDRGFLAQVNAAYGDFESPLKRQLQRMVNRPAWRAKAGTVAYVMKNNEVMFTMKNKARDLLLRAKGRY